jgi:phospholipid transport system substrate-binding protein
VNALGRTLGTLIGVGFLALAFPGLVSATDSPLNVIQTTMQRVIAILQDPAYQDPERNEERIKKVRELTLPQFDSREIAKRTLGIHWRDRTEEQREEFIRLFIDLVEKTYSSTLDRYREDTEFFFDREHIDGTYAEVDSRITAPSLNKTFSLNYRLHLVEGRWLIYDVVIENVSMVRNYRTQFNRIINKSSYENLVQSIQSKLKQLAASSS